MLKLSASKYAIQIRTADKLQNEAFQSVLPLNNAKINVKRTFSVDRLSTMPPMNVQALFDQIRGFHGLNAINDNLVLIDRQNNLSGMITSVEHSGKTFACKREVFNALASRIVYRGAGDLLISKAPTEPQYVLNPDNPHYVIKNDDKGLTVFTDGKQDRFIARDTPDFPTTAIAILESIKHPVILSEAEMKSEDKMTFIEYRTYDNVDNEALCAIRFQESLEKQDLHIENPEKYGDLSEAQKEALERSKKYEIEEKTMDAKEGKELSDKRLEKLLNRQKQQEMSQSPEM